MSHFLCLVIPGTDTEPAKISKRIETLLDPYDENKEMPSYQEECYCRGNIAQRHGSDVANEMHGQRGIGFLAAHPEFSVEKSEPEHEKDLKRRLTLYEKFCQPWDAYAEAAKRKHPMYNQCDPKCDECHGKGLRTTTANPKGHWDWFEIGGRWDGFVHQMATGRKLNQNFVRITKANYKKFSGYAVVDAKGTWHSKGKMGWFGISHDSMQEKRWTRTQHALFKKHIGYLVVGVDCHS